MPINVVVIAAIALIILLVLIGIFTGKIKWFVQGLATCPGDCMTEDRCTEEGGYNLGRNYLMPDTQRTGGGLKEGAKCTDGDSTWVCCSAREIK